MRFTRRGRRPDDRQLPGSDPIADVVNRRRPCRRSGRLGRRSARSARHRRTSRATSTGRSGRSLRLAGVGFQEGAGADRAARYYGRKSNAPRRALMRPCHMCPKASDLRGCRHSELSDASPNHPGIFKEWSPMSDRARDPTERAGITRGCPATTIPRQGSAVQRQPPALSPCGYGLPCLV